MEHNVPQGAFPQDGVGHPRQHKVWAAGTELSEGKASQDKPALVRFLNKCKVAEGNCAAVLCGCGRFCLVSGHLKTHLSPG